ncbi:Platinum sensitivity protein [Mortierella sp. AD010]|nr:Platinum sensitivity protein [Mortierella sp. AD010]
MDPLVKMRVKVYKLSTCNQWIDQGTGHCSCEFNQDKSEGTLIVHSEDEEDKVLLDSRIRVGEDLYQRQQDTLIVWTEDNGEDLALSFQEAEGCGEIWENIIEVQQHYAEDLFSDPSDVNGVGSGEFTTLPNPELSNLAEIENMLKEAQNELSEKEKLAAFIIMDSYIDKLFPILEACEDLESRSDLNLLHGIMLGIIMLNDIAVIQYILKDEVIIGCLGMLEYDPELGDNKEDYREFLTKRTKYKQIVPINDPDVEQKIHQAFRTLSQNGLFNVFEMALSDEEPKIKMAGTEIFLSAMEHDPNLVRSYIVKQAEEAVPKKLMDIILDQFLAEGDTGIKLQFSEVIRILLDTNTSQIENGMQIAMNAPPNLDPDADVFLELFYKSYVEKFVSPLLELSDDTVTFTRSVASVCENICQILAFMVRHHTFRSKYYVLSNGIVGKVCLLLKNRDQHLRLAALRFFRTCVGLNDEFYNRYLIKNNIFQHIVDALLSTHNRNNLLNSACIEFFEFIRNENIKSLITHVVSMHGEKLKHIEYVNTFKALIRRYEQLQDTSVADSEAAEAATIQANATKRGGTQKAWSSSTMDDDEEAYFNNSDDEDEVPDEGKHEDDPPTSDLRRRVKEDSDEESDHSGHGNTPTNSVMEGDSGPILASQTSPPPPPSLLRRKLVDYGDEDDDEEEKAFNRRLRNPSSPPSTTDQPPEKKAKLDPEQGDETGTTAHQDEVMRDSPDPSGIAPGLPSQKAVGASVPEGSSPSIKFKLNNLRNGRSPSPNTRSRSVSPLPSGLPSVTMRTGIAFVKAGSTDSDGHLSDNDSKAGASGKQDVLDEAAIHLRSDMARDFRRLEDDGIEDLKHNGSAQPESTIPSTAEAPGSEGKISVEDEAPDNPE